MTDEQIEFFRSLDQRGEVEVRRILASNGWNERRTAWAHAWLAEQDQSRTATQHRQSLEQSRSSARAAWAGVWIAALALMVSGIALVRTF